MFQVTEINTIEELRTYKLAWEELWSRGRSKRFQLSFAWLEAYWEHAEHDRSLKVLVATLANRVIGILPLVTKKTESRLGSVNILTYPLDGWGSWYGPIGPNCAATLTAGMRYLSTSTKGWDLLDLSYTDRDRLDLGRTVTAARNIGWSSLERIWQQVPYIQLEESWDQFLNGKNENKIKQILAAEAELAALGKVSLQHYRSGTGTDSELNNQLQAWQEIAKSSPDTKALEDFSLIECIAQAADNSEQLDIAVLTLDNKPIAATLGFVHEHGVEIVKSISVPEQPPAIESVLLGRLLEQGILLGDESFEVCANCSLSETARELWATKILNSYRYSCTPLKHLRGTLLLKYHSATSPRISQKRRMEPLHSKTGRTDTASKKNRNAPAINRKPSQIKTTSDAPTPKVYS